jgi:hypothetical protein
MNKAAKTELEAAAFRRLIAHLQERTDVQNIDMMNLAGFCRNCISRWYRQAAEASSIDMDEAEARKIVYGMEYADWKAQHQFIERVERLEEEKRALMADIKDVYAEAKATGFEPKIMRQVVRLRAMDRDLLSEQDALLDTYRDALGLR